METNLSDHSSARISNRESEQKLEGRRTPEGKIKAVRIHGSKEIRDSPDRRMIRSRRQKQISLRKEESGETAFIKNQKPSLSEKPARADRIRQRRYAGKDDKEGTALQQDTRRLRVRDKKIQRMTRDGLVEENLQTKKTSRISKRETDVRLVQKDLEEGKSHVPGRHNTHPARRRQKAETSASKMYEKTYALSDKRGDARKEENGGAVKPKEKNRLRFTYEEAGTPDPAEKPVRTGRRNSREQSERYQNTDYFNLRENKELEKQTKLSYQETAKSGGTELKKHSNKELVYRSEYTGKKQSRLRHAEPESLIRKTMTATAGAVVSAAKAKVYQDNDGNNSVQAAIALQDGAGKTAQLAQRSVRARKRKTVKKQIRAERKLEKAEVRALYREALEKDERLKNSSLLRKQIQKARIKREYAKAKRMDPAMQAPVGSVDFIKKIGGKVTNFFKEHQKAYVSIAVLIGILMLIMGSFTSCSVMFFNNVVDYSGYSYMSEDEALRDADLYYTQLEAALQEKINQMEVSHPGYDKYRYELGVIEHDPFVLMSYLSSKYEVFKFDHTIRAELDSLFAQQYQMTTTSSTETITETKTVRVGQSLGQVVTSGYCNCVLCCGQWAGGPTASGAYPTSNHTIAVDAHTPFVPLGTRIVMNGREYVVEDTGDFSRYGVAFDVYYDNHQAASNHGHQTWEAYLADANGQNEIQVTTTSVQSILTVNVSGGSLTAICQDRLNGEQKEWFHGYNESKGNLQMFESPLDYNWYYLISSYYGYRIHPISGQNELHNGLDITAMEGTSVMAGLTGTVKTASYNDSYGNFVVLTDSDGYELRYAHLSHISVSPGQSIEKGTEIGIVGSSGNSTGPHLHLELFHNGERLNPLFYFETGEGTIFGNVEYSREAARKLCEYAVQFLGTPYVWGGYQPGAFDCSGFVSYCLTHSGVKNTGHMDTWGLISNMTVIPESEMQPGDIIFFQGTYNAPPPTHVGIYLGNGQMVHSGHPNQIVSIYSPYYQQHWYKVARW